MARLGCAPSARAGLEVGAGVAIGGEGAGEGGRQQHFSGNRITETPALCAGTGERAPRNAAEFMG